MEALSKRRARAIQVIKNLGAMSGLAGIGIDLTLSSSLSIHLVRLPEDTQESPPIAYHEATCRAARKPSY